LAKIQEANFGSASIDFCRKESRKRQDQKQEMGFHDLLLNVYEVLISEHGQHLIDALGNRYPAMLVDEFQDTDLLQIPNL